MLQSIKNLSIRRKLKLAFGTIILFCTVAALLGALGIGTVFTHSRTLYTDYGQAQGAVNRILAVFKQNELITGSLLLNRDPQGQQQLLTALTANRADLLDRLEAGDAAGYFDHLDPGDLLELESLLDTYFAAQAQVVQMVEDGSADDAVSRFTQELLVAGEAVDGMVQQIIAAQELAGQEMLSRLGTTTAQVMILLGGFALFALIYSLVVTIRMSASICQSVQGLMDGMESLRAGVLSTRIPVRSLDDLGRISQKFNETCETLDTCVSHVNATMEQVAAGRLVYDDTTVFQGDCLTMQQSIVRMIEQENQLIRLVQSTTEQVSSAAGQVSAAAQNLAQGATEQASSVEELSAAMSDFSTRMSAAVEDAAATSRKAGEAGNLTEQTNEKMDQMLEAMAQIYAASQEMGRVVQSIENIAFQTNLLALNAAVEAARAGSAGKGFAVIADTVRHLAIKSSEEAKETARLLQSTQSAVDLGRELAADAAGLLRDTAGAAEESAASTARVLSALTEQTAALEQIDSGLEQISAVIQNNSASSQESAAASEQLHAQSSELERHVRVFSLD